MEQETGFKAMTFDITAKFLGVSNNGFLRSSVFNPNFEDSESFLMLNKISLSIPQNKQYCDRNYSTGRWYRTEKY